MLYDGLCPVCVTEIRFLEFLQKNRPGKVDFVDISLPAYDGAKYKDVSYEMAMEEMHVIDETGKVRLHFINVQKAVIFCTSDCCIGRFLQISVNIKTSWVTCRVLAGSPRGPGVCGHVRRCRPRLVGSLHDVVACETVHGQVLRHLCPESLKVDRTWGGVRHRTL